ncbi:MAG: glycosyltransferase family 4 protein [Bacilli bacterium]|nr:glycosyltransferase family 4 protein [Bacilli bacterium]
MKKISILALHLGYGGIEKSIATLANTLALNYEVEIASVYKLYDDCVYDLNKKVKVKYLNTDLKPNRNSFKSAISSKNVYRVMKEALYSIKVLYYRRKKMINYIQNCDSDVIISTRDLFNYWLSGYGHDGVIKIGWEHNHFHENLKYANNVSRSARNLDYLVLVSSELQKFYAEQLRNSSCMCVYIPNSIDKMPEKRAELKNKKLISVGRLSPEKGYIDLLKIYNIFHKKHPDWTLDIVGDGVEREKLEKYISKNNLDDCVKLHGFRGKDYIDNLLHNSSIYLMTSLTESFGIVLIEAMSHGVPCIAYDSAEGAREIINSGYNGYLIKNRNSEAMIMKIEDLIKSEKERIKLGKQARESVKKYASDIVGEEWLTLIEESDIYE